MSVPSYNGYAKIPSMSSCLMTLVTWTRGRMVPRVELSNRAFTRSATQNETSVECPRVQNTMSCECRQRECSRLPLGGHLQAKGKGEDPKPPGERQLKLN